VFDTVTISKSKSKLSSEVEKWICEDHRYYVAYFTFAVGFTFKNGYKFVDEKLKCVTEDKTTTF
jgi:hypothetical protein